jgi:hypothetical protein
MEVQDLQLDHKLVDSIAKLAQSTQNADKAVAIKEIPGDPDQNKIIVLPNGTYEYLEIETQPRNPVLRSVDQIGEYIRHAVDKWGADPVVYFNSKQVIGVLDESTLRPSRNGRVAVTLTESPQLLRLRRYSENRNDAWLAHKAFMQMLRIDLEDCISPESLEYLLKALSSLDFMDASRTTSNVSRNRESLGSEIKAEIKAAGDMQIPEEVSLEVRLFTDPALLSRRQIVCKLETDPSNSRLALIPIANEIENAMDNEMASLGDMLRANINSRATGLPDKTKPDAKTEQPKPRAFVPVFHGAP